MLTIKMMKRDGNHHVDHHDFDDQLTRVTTVVTTIIAASSALPTLPHKMMMIVRMLIGLQQA